MVYKRLHDLKWLSGSCGDTRPKAERKVSPLTYQNKARRKKNEEKERKKEKEREKRKKKEKKKEKQVGAISLDLRRSGGRSSSGQELKLVYATRVTHGYRNHGISLRFRVREV